jgi:putative ABC transport system permease protein
MRSLYSDFRSAVRGLSRSPGLVTTITLSLALGVGAVIAVFNVVYAVVLRPLPYPFSDRIIEVTMSEPKAGIRNGRISFPDYRDWLDSSRSFASLAAISDESFALTGAGGAERISGARVTPGFFKVFGLQPVVGEVPLEKWQEPGARLAVVSHALWESRFGKEPRVLGRALRLDDELYTVVAVLPLGVEFPHKATVWLPLDPADPDTGAEVRGGRYLRVMARLREGGGITAAAREMEAISHRLAQTYPKTNEGLVTELTLLHEELVRDLRPGLLFLSTAVGLVLLIVCINLAGILVARGIARGGEMWIRLALGASRKRLVRLLLLENVGMALVGGGAGLLVGIATSRLLVGLHPGDMDFAAAKSGGGVLIAAALAVALASGFLVSLPVVIQMVLDRRHASSIRGISGRAPTRFTVRAQATLMVLQIAVALALLDAAGLMLHSVVKLLSVNPGFRAESLLTARVSLPPSRYPETYQRAAFFRELLQRLNSVPGIESAAAVTNLPFSGSDMLFGFTPLPEARARQASAAASLPKAHYRAASPGYFRTLGVPLLNGRDLDAGDEAESPPVVVVNQTFVRRFLPTGSALGRSIHLMFGNGKPRRIVGIVGDLRHFGLEQEPEPELYVPYPQQPWGFMTLVVRTPGDALRAASLLRAEIAKLDPDQPVDEMATMEDLVADSIARPRFYVVLLGAFALLALVTATVGVYGFTSQWVNLRRKEMGIHVALGASPGRIRNLFLQRPLVLALTGLLLGGALALTQSRILTSLLFRVSPRDPASLMGTAAILLLVVFFAAWLPALRASRVDAVTILRND